MAIVEVAHVAAPHRLHELRQAGGAVGRRQQVEVVVHQDVGMQRDAEAHGVLGHQREQLLMVRPVHEDWLAVVATLDHVVRHACQGETGKTGHGWC